MRRTLVTLSICAVAFALVARAADTIPFKKVDKPAPTVELTPEQIAQMQREAEIKQEQLKRQFDDFKQSVVRLAQRLESSTKQEDKDKAIILKKAITLASEQGVDAKFTTLISELKRGDTFKDLDKLQDLIAKNGDLRNDIRALIELLLKDDRDAALREERLRTERMIERLKEIIAKQERVRALTEQNRMEADKLKDAQVKVTKETKELIEPGKKGDTKKGEAKNAGDNKNHGKAEAKYDTKENKAETVNKNPGESKDSNPAESKNGEGKDSKETGKDDKNGESKEGSKNGEGKPSDSKENKNGEGKDSKPGDSKEGSKAGEGKDSKPGDSKENNKGAESKDGKGGEGKEGKPGDSKEGKDGDSKDGKGGEGKESKDGKGGEGKEGKGGEGKEGKSSESKDGGKGGEGKEGKGGEGKSGQGKEGMGGEGKEGQPSQGKESKSGEAGKGGEAKSGESKSGQGKPGDGKPGDGKGGEAKGSEAKAGKPGNPDSKGGAGKPGEGKGGEAKSGQGKSGEGKDGKGSPSKEGQGSDSKGKGEGKGEGKGGESKPGKGGEAGKGGEGKPGQGQGGQGGEGKPSKSPPAGPPPESTPVKKQIQDSNKYQESAGKNIEGKDNSAAGKDQDDAIAALERAKKQLEDLLKQLREEEIERLLAALQGRCERMLALQIAVRDQTVNIKDRVVDKATGKPNKLSEEERRATEQEANIQSDKEDEIVQEANVATRLIEAEGSAVAFLEVFKQVRGDMINVAGRLRKTDVGTVTVAVENDIISTLQEMVEALKQTRKNNQSPPMPPPPPGEQGPPPDQKLISQIAELKMIRSMQMKVNNRTTLYGKEYPGEQAPAPAQAKTEAEREHHEMIQRELKELATSQEKIGKVTDDISKGKNKAN